MQPSDVILPLDLKGTLPGNLQTDEPHTLVTANARLIVPVYGAFFREGLVITDVATGDPVPNTAFMCMDFYQNAGLRTGKDVYNTIVIVDDTVSNNVTITYQALGGPFSRNRAKLEEWLADRELNQGALDWSEVTNIPKRVQPSHHLHLLAHVYGMEYIVEGLGRIEDAVLKGSSPVYDQALGTIEQRLAAVAAAAQAATSHEILLQVESFKTSINKSSIGLGLLENLGLMTKAKGAQVGRAGFDPNTDGTREYVTMDSLDGFSETMHQEIVSRVQTHLGSANGYVANPHRSTLLGMTNGEVVLFRSSKEVVDAGGVFDLDIYPSGASEGDGFVVTKISNGDTHYGGVFLAINQNTGEVYRGLLLSDSCDARLVWKRMLFDGDMTEFAALIEAHIVDNKNPHELEKKHLGLGKVENLPVVTVDQLNSQTSARVYITMDTLMYFAKKWMTNAKPPPLPGEEVDPNAVLMDQAQIIFTKCKEGPPAQVWPSKDQLIRSYCDGTDKFGRFTDGAGGYYDKTIELNSDDCQYVEIPKQGTLLSQACGEGEYPATTMVGTYADGRGGTYFGVIELKSSKCGGTQNPAVHPAEGTLLDTFCSGTDKKAKHADGRGGSYEVTIALNAPDCGYTPPATFPPAHQELSRSCVGLNMVARYTDGLGGTYTEVVRYNAPDCGGTSPTTPGVTPPTGTPPGVTPPTGTPPGGTPTPEPTPPPPRTEWTPEIFCSGETWVQLHLQWWFRVDYKNYPPNTTVQFQCYFKDQMENDSAFRIFPPLANRDRIQTTDANGFYSKTWYAWIEPGALGNLPSRTINVGVYTDAFTANDGLPVRASNIYVQEGIRIP